MHKLGISRTLIVLLYIAIVLREIVGLSEIFIMTKFHFIDYADTDGQPLYLLGTAMRCFSTSLDVTIILTNYQLYLSMLLVRNKITSDSRKTWNQVARSIGLAYTIVMTIVTYVKFCVNGRWWIP